MKKALITIPLTILATLAVAGTAEAHNATASGSCQQGVSWSATNYEKAHVNSITVSVDGTVRYSDADFKASDTGSIPTDKTVAHTWSVVVNAPGTEYDRNLSGNYPACVVPSTTTVAPTTTVVTTTTEPATTTTVVAVGEPPVPTTTLAPAGRSEPVCEPDMPCWPCRDDPGYVCPAPVTVVYADVLLVEPSLPVTGTNDTLLYGAALLVFVGLVLLGVRRRA